ncbi:MAG: hypothetical protein LBO08_02555 [Rickettsiales bacterium]|nr:hypothetical protein [Rickettsiales bacterium]
MKQIIALCFLLYALCACTTTATRLDGAVRDYSSGNFSAAAGAGLDDNLQTMISGDALFQENKFALSDAQFEKTKIKHGGLASEAGKLLGGQMAGDYAPYMMDTLFVKYYQIWDALALGDSATARVVINQSYDLQTKMSREYKKLISKNKSETLPDGLQNDWAAYADIMNPALMYLSGIYFLNTAQYNDDWENARLYLTRAAGMSPQNRYIGADTLAANSRARPENTAWVFLDAGFAPRLVEQRFDFPMTVDGELRVISIAASHPVFNGDTMLPSGASQLADTDKMFMTEYKEYRINDIIRAIAAAVARLGIQSAATSRAGPLGGLAAAIYSMATTTAEIRTWATLPRRIYTMRVKKNKSGLIELNYGANLIQKVEVPFDGNHLIYIRITDRPMEPKVMVIPRLDRGI